MPHDRLNQIVVAVLIVGLVVVGWFLRVRASEPSTPSGVVATASSAASPGPTPSGSTSASASGSPSGSASPDGGITTVAFVGDSFAAGVGASSEAKRWTSLVATAHHWTEKNFGHPQTGYAAFGTLGPCATPANACPTYLAQVPAIVAAAPELVILTGGGNDLGLDQAAVKANIDQTLSALKTGLPKARIVVVNPWWDMRPQPESLATMAEALKSSASTAGVTWADTGQPIVGKVSLVTSDGLQANDAGHAAMAAAIEGALKLASITS